MLPERAMTIVISGSVLPAVVVEMAETLRCFATHTCRN